MDCIFCKIVRKEEQATLVYEDDAFLVFPDIYPKAPIHLLIIPKKHIEIFSEIENAQEKELAAGMLFVAQKVAREKKLNGYKLQMNVGKEGGQDVDHIHLHLLAEK